MAISDVENLDIEPGYYIVAVSGGVDSMTLLDVLVKRSAELDREPGQEPGRLKLVVAHFDHGIRKDSEQDRRLVQDVAQKHQLPFVFDLGNLGPNCSEARARQARYQFLERIKQVAGADAIITAHHSDDMLETAIINILRGTGPKGLSSLKNREGLIRPLLDYSKEQINKYATQNKLVWREDSTNADETYLRNYVRGNILSKFSPDDKTAMLKHLQQAADINKEVDELVASLHSQNGDSQRLDKKWFIGLPHKVATNIMVTWLSGAGVQYDRKLVERLVMSAKTLQNGKIVDINNGCKMVVEGKYLALK